MEFEKTIELNIEDIFRNRIRNKSLLILLFYFIYMLVLSCAVIGIPFLWSVLITVVVTILTIIYTIRSMKGKIKTLYASSRIVRLPIHMHLDDIGVHIASEISTTNYLWQDFKQAQESKHAIYLIVSTGNSIMIPKRLLDADESTNVLDIIKKRLTGQPATPSQ